MSEPELKETDSDTPSRKRVVRKWAKRMAWSVAGLWLVAFLLLDVLQVEKPDLAPKVPMEETVLLPQGIPDGWGKDGRQWFYHVSQGTLIMPYEWLVALEQPDISAFATPAEQFINEDYMRHFGFLAGEAHETFNPGGVLPLGFAIEYDFNDPVPDETKVYNAVGLTCSACHTGQLTYGEKTLRIEGGAALVDLRGFQKALGRAVAYTLLKSSQID